MRLMEERKQLRAMDNGHAGRLLALGAAPRSEPVRQKPNGHALARNPSRLAFM
jgi:hypothetical protein